MYIDSGTVTFSSCNINGNRASNVRAHAQSSHRPHGKITDVLALTHACTTANASVNYSRYVRQRPEKFPSPQWEFHMFCACACRAAVFLSAVAR